MSKSNWYYPKGYELTPVIVLCDIEAMIFEFEPKKIGYKRSMQPDTDSKRPTRTISVFHLQISDLVSTKCHDSILKANHLS